MMNKLEQFLFDQNNLEKMLESHKLNINRTIDYNDCQIYGAGNEIISISNSQYGSSARGSRITFSLEGGQKLLKWLAEIYGYKLVKENIEG